jgi:hypothetical protein
VVAAIGAVGKYLAGISSGMGLEAVNCRLALMLDPARVIVVFAWAAGPVKAIEGITMASAASITTTGFEA